MDSTSSAVQAAFVACTIGKIGLTLYKRWMAPRWAADRYLAKADATTRVIMEEVENGHDFEVHQLTVDISSQTMDTPENSTTKRRVRSKAPFRAYLVRSGKAKFGLMKRTPANVMCVRKYLYDLCVVHGVIARHICENVDIASELVFIPTAHELETLAMQSSRYGKRQQTVRSILSEDAQDC